ncbi:unnamed protein product [Rotaria magnacalcarata]|uniref:Ubiquitin-like domain-containing protein n=1 Tax=Rotaria magnacalcarata TaxID=392030 RepID=A0A816M0T5_9BILA|nr:unnamed protein product [Rotaria magnacalcarata]CAF2203131.1 unnamed protein product [Rotaria magnacalcarata]CAF3828709.1 unnamed protein product [Rotaria magnacalcarata]CAF4074927.1 unnamed protein product [Rotaria magnacalcarata]
MGSNYDYTYDYEVNDSHKHSRTARDNTGQHGQRTARNQSNYAANHSTFSRANNMDTLANFQHDRIWHKLYDPLETDKTSQDNEVQKMARRPDRKVIKIEAAYGSDRQTIIVKRNYDLRVRDIQEDASKVFKMPLDQIILYWKGRNICETPNELLEILGIENNHQMRVCRADDPAQQDRRRELRSFATSDQQYSSSNDIYQQQQQFHPQFQQQPPYSNPSIMYDQQQQQQQQFGTTTPRANYYQQLTNPNVAAPVAPAFILSLQINFVDRAEGLVVGRPHPITIYDLQFELQQRFNVPILDQNLAYNGMPLAQYPPDAPLDTLGIGNNSLISLWYRGQPSNNQQQQAPPNEYYSARPQVPPTFYGDGSQLPRGTGGPADISLMRTDNPNIINDPMQNGNNQDVLKIEVFHGSDRHVIILRSANNLRINDLMEELQRITNVPVQRQKLYFRGRELQNQKESTLRDAGIDNNAQVRLIGDPTKARYEAMITGNRTN